MFTDSKEMMAILTVFQYATILMIFPTSVVSTDIKEINLKVNESQTLQCNISNDTLKSWFINGVLLQHTNHYPDIKLVDNDTLLVINNNTSSIFGLVNITCNMTSSNGSGYASQIFHVWFFKGAEIYNKKSTEQHVLQNIGVVLYIDCNATGYPTPRIHWLVEKEVLNSSHIYEDQFVLSPKDGTVIYSTYSVLKNGTLKIKNPLPNDHKQPSRNVTCVAFNSIGQDHVMHMLFFGRLITRSFRAVLLPSKLPNLKENVDKKINAVFQKGKLYHSKNITSIDEKTGTVTFSITWKERSLKSFYGDPINVQLLANDVHKALDDGGLKPLVFYMNDRPPPPTNLAGKDIESDRIVLTWRHPDYFEVESYQIITKTKASWKNAKKVKGTDAETTLEDLESDTKYLIKIQSVNSYGGGTMKSEVLEVRTKASSKVVTIVVVIIVVIIIITILIFAFLHYRRKRKEKQRHRLIIDTNPYEQSIPGIPLQNIYIHDGRTHIRLNEGSSRNADTNNFSWREISRDQITIEDDCLGEGEFGLVKKGMWHDSNNDIPVAIKSVKEMATETDRKELFKELRLMVDVGQHSNIVNLHGACSVEGHLWVVVEFCENGNLLNFLKKNRTMISESDFVTSLEVWRRAKFAFDVSKGMTFLQRKKIVHRDLAARNVLLGKNLTAKVSDFGLSRDIYETGLYHKTTEGKLPVKWMSIESLQDFTFTCESDVWSFGILCWEIESAGLVPYPGMAGQDVLSRLQNGYRLPKPKDTPAAIYEIMMSCWEASPKIRPKFQEIKTRFESFLDESSGYLPIIVDENMDELLNHSYVNYMPS